jgi:catechol 2,3-dioxygenase-like lactoylglutathione lyase family enzyme
MGYVIPTLRSTDFERSRSFYTEALGFQVDWEWRDAPGLPAFAQVSREGMLIYLSEGEGDSLPGGLVYLYVKDVDAWHREFCQRGVPIERGLFDQAWGNREFRVLDPDGNTLCFCTPTRQPRAEA